MLLAVLDVEVLFTLHMVCMIVLERREHKGNGHLWTRAACAGGPEHKFHFQARSDCKPAVSSTAQPGH